jgi:spermidine synthase
MATIWQKKSNNTRYEVRSASNTIRLYTNGIFHSQWNPKNSLSGHLWDIFLLAVFFKNTPPQKALVLGVGGGAAIKLIEHFFASCQIDGVDIDETHLYIAKRFFGCKSNHCHLIHDDATQFIASSKRRYDYIVEDIFSGDARTQEGATRAIDADQIWLEKLSKRLAKNGLLVINMESLSHARKLKKVVAFESIRIQSSFIFTTPRYENAIIVLANFKSDLKSFKQNLDQHFGALKAKKYTSPFTVRKF